VLVVVTERVSGMDSAITVRSAKSCGLADSREGVSRVTVYSTDVRLVVGLLASAGQRSANSYHSETEHVHFVSVMVRGGRCPTVTDTGTCVLRHI